MKGALWTLNISSFGMLRFCRSSVLLGTRHLFNLLGKYAVAGGPDCFVIGILSHSGAEPTLATELIRRLFGCEHNEKVSILSYL